MFIATANGLETISEPLRDRMEIIELSGYTYEEKVPLPITIYLKKQLTDSGLEDHNISLSDELLHDINMKLHPRIRRAPIRTHYS